MRRAAKPAPVGDALPLSFVPEHVLPQAGSAVDLACPPVDFGHRLVADVSQEIVGSTLSRWVEGRVGGPAAAEWAHGQYVLEGATEVCRVGPVWWFPKFGLLIDSQGRAAVSPAGEVRHNWPMLDPVPGVSQVDGVLSFSPPHQVEQLCASTVALPWGMSNYGHFVLDGLAAILAVDETGLLERFPLVVPPLKLWQRALIRGVFGDIPMREVQAPVVRLDGAVFSTAMDHFLHAPGPLTLRLRERVRTRLPQARASGRRLYVSRRAQHMRVMVDEARLEAALVARGFEIIRPERLTVADQLLLFKEAGVVVGASGAGLANVLFAGAGTKVIEIQPENFTSFWTPAICRAAGLDWSGYVCASPGPSADAPWRSRIRRGFRFAYRLDVADFMAFLDSRL